jgi:TolB-like protein
MSFVSELRRRQVFRTAAWYGGLAWLAVEVADTVFPRFGLPDWLVRAVIVGAALGLPLALALAWSFDLSALGIRRETGVVPAPSDRAGFPSARSAVPLWSIPSFWIALAIAVGLTVSAQQAWQRLIRPAFGERPGIAVLPFANLSPDPANAYFADGLHEEILATLARVSGLRVISRTSVVKYRDSELQLPEIAKALDVPLILEGSVRREGDDLRLTLQLIDGRTDTHLWAETYDRKFENALHLQRAVAEQIVAAIGTQLTLAEGQRIERSAPTDPEAYAYYLQALAGWSHLATLPELRVVEGLLTRALELDPDFGLGHALRAKVRVWIATTTEGPHTKADAQGARLDIERALELEPELPEGLAARAYYTTYVERNAAGAIPDLNRALTLAPNDADTHGIAGLTARRLGRFDDAISHFREAARLMPAEPLYSGRIIETLEGQGRFDEAERVSRENERRLPSIVP